VGASDNLKFNPLLSGEKKRGGKKKGMLFLDVGFGAGYVYRGGGGEEGMKSEPEAIVRGPKRGKKKGRGKKKVYVPHSNTSFPAEERRGGKRRAFIRAARCPADWGGKKR